MVKDELLKFIGKNDDFSFAFGKVKKALAGFHFSDNEILDELNNLRIQGLIFLNDQGQYVPFPDEYLIGQVSLAKKGNYGIIVGKSRYSINKDQQLSALNNDIVVCKKDKNGFYDVVQILKRNTKKIVCEIARNEENELYLIPQHLGYQFKVHVSTLKDKKEVDGKKIKLYYEGQIVSVNIGTELFDDSVIGEIEEVIGHKTDPDIDLKSIAIVNGFNPNFHEETLEQLNDIPLIVQQKDLTGRLDLRDKTIFTIDGAHTKDIDDAVSIERLPNGHYLLGVHIAHVSNYVKIGTPLFNEAGERGNSLYMLDTVIPMLPRELSNGICSLNEDEDRLTRTVFMEYDEEGKQVDFRICKSVIHSKKKMTYEAVNEIIENDNIPNGYEPFTNDLKMMLELSNILTKRKDERGYIGFASEEAQFEFDENGNPIKVNTVTPKTAEHIIENFMIEANSTIAEYVYWQGKPFVYRNHGIPDSERIFEAVRLLKTLGYRILKLKHIDDPSTIQLILNNLTNKEEYPILSTLILRTMEKAYYSTENIGHFGLSLGCYTHYTSPIRRLSDLIVHTLLDMYDECLDVSPELLLEIRRLCAVASMQERNADIAEYQAYKLACIKVMRNEIGNEFEVFISDITPNKVKIKMENGIEGVIDFSKVGIPYEYKDENKAIMIKGHDTLLIGRKITVELEELSMENLELYFTLPALKENNLKRTRQL